MLNNAENANYADVIHSAPVAGSDNIDDLIAYLQNLQKICLNGLMVISKKSSLGKCRLLVSSCEKMKMEKGDFKIENSGCEKLLGVYFDNTFSFD